jgi:glycosyltransferase involved in cell wall biosynthesis
MLLVGPLPPPSGGMANQTRQLARLLEQDDCRVTVVQTNPPYRPAWVGRVRVVRAFFRLAPYLRALWRASRDVEVVHVMANSGWAWHLFAAPAIRIAHARGRPVIVNYRGGGAEAFLARQSFLIMPTLRRASQIVVPSPFLERVFRAHGVATEVVPNIVDLARFYPAERPPAEPHIIVARNLEDIYDIPTALRAFAQIRKHHAHARLTVVGSGPTRVSLERIAHELGLTAAVTFTGRLDNERMGDLYRTADLVLNPSRVDNMPVSLLEAMASGVPIVSTNAGGIPDMVDDGKTALLVPIGDPPAMAAAALRVLENPELAHALRAAGIDAATHYTWERVRPPLYAAYGQARGARSRVHDGGARERAPALPLPCRGERQD